MHLIQSLFPVRLQAADLWVGEGKMRIQQVLRTTHTPCANYDSRTEGDMENPDRKLGRRLPHWPRNTQPHGETSTSEHVHSAEVETWDACPHHTGEEARPQTSGPTQRRDPVCLPLSKLPNNPSISLMHESAYRLTGKKAKTLITDSSPSFHPCCLLNSYTHPSQVCQLPHFLSWHSVKSSLMQIFKIYTFIPNWILLSLHSWNNAGEKEPWKIRKKDGNK